MDPGLEYEDPWNESQYYQQGDVVLTEVTHTLHLYTLDHPNINRFTNTWEAQVLGYTSQGEWTGTDHNSFNPMFTKQEML